MVIYKTMESIEDDNEIFIIKKENDDFLKFSLKKIYDDKNIKDAQVKIKEDFKALESCNDNDFLYNLKNILNEYSPVLPTYYSLFSNLVEIRKTMENCILNNVELSKNKLDIFNKNILLRESNKTNDNIISNKSIKNKRLKP